jgi:hypothetical protein
MAKAPPRLCVSARTITRRLKIRCPTARSLCSTSRMHPASRDPAKLSKWANFGALIVTPNAPLSVTLVTIRAPTVAPALPMDSPFCVRKPAFCDGNSHVGAKINWDKRQIDPRDSCATLPSRGKLP